MHASAIDFYGLLVEIDGEITGVDDRLRVALRATHYRVDAGDQFVLVERLGDVVVGTEAETLDLILDAEMPDRIKIGVFTLETRSVRSTS